MKKILFLIIIVSSLSFAQKSDLLFQYSSIGALMSGNYDGTMSFKELSRQGNFGLGTIDNLDGEMVAIDGRFYQVRSDGKVIEINNKTETPFAVVKFFNSDKVISLRGSYTSKQFTAILDSLFRSNNYPTAIKVKARFETMKTRSVPAQKRPYPSLAEAAKNQSVFNFEKIDGCIVGFYFPKYFEGINVSGYHIHFISDDRQKGGHVLDYVVNDPEIMFDYATTFRMQLLDKFEDSSALQIPKQQELEKIEK
jgi:acetolactate decarboxylase